MAQAIQACFGACALVAATGLLVCNPSAAQSARNWSGKIPLPSGPAGQSLVAGSSTLRQPQIVAGRFDPYTVSGTSARITQTDAAGILRWGSFDIAPGYTVTIDQPSAAAILLNKVDGGAFDNKTVIDGLLNARGQVYIYNSNGIIFGKNSQVNVNSLTATSLKIGDSRFLAGILVPSLDPILAADVAAPGAITVEGDATAHAQITAAAGGRILLAAPQVSNNGALVAKDGQVILAAGSSVFLHSPSDANMRGLVVQVGNYSDSDKALNDVLGSIDVGHGNATLVGLAVNQSGRISATTSVNLNGSVYLRATAGTPATDNGVPQVGGELRLGAGSSTRIDPDLTDTATAADDPAFKPSLVDLQGQHIVLEENAAIVAQGGKVTIAAHANPDPKNLKTFSPSRVDFGAGSLIDVSGSTGTELAMESNVITVELRGTELADYPLLRDSALRGSKANIDIRKGTAIANVSGWLNQVQHNVGERTAAGGSVSVVSEGDIIQRSGSLVDVSGGWVRYRDGYVDTTKLSFLGRLVDIGAASAAVAYDGSTTPGAGPRNFEKGYLQGYDAGSVSFSAPAMALQGSLSGAVTLGERQRDSGQTAATLLASGAAKYANGFVMDAVDSGKRVSYMADRLRPRGGALTIGSAAVVDASSGRPAVVGTADQMGYSGTISLNGAALTPSLPAPGLAMDAASEASPLDAQLNLDTAALSAAGFAYFTALSSGSIRVDAPVALAAGGRLTLGASGDITFNAGMTAHGGKLIAAAGGAFDVAAGSSFDFSGLWTNDYGTSAPLRDAANNLTGTIVMSGGGVDLAGRVVSLGNQVSIDVSGGAWLGADAKLSKGGGGTIRLEMRRDSSTDTGAALILGNDLVLSGYGLSQGGSLSLKGRGVVIGAAAARAGDLAISDGGFFSAGGFTNYSLSSVDDLTVADTTSLRPRALSWLLARGYQSLSSGAMNSVAAPATLDLVGPAGGRPAVSLSLNASGRTLFGSGASLELDPKASATLSASRQVTVDGTISAPAGTIKIGLSAATPGPADSDYDATRSLWFGPSAQLLARGTTALIFVNPQGIATGDVLGGGSIKVGKFKDDGSMIAASGYLVAEPGSVFDVSGVTSAPLTFMSARSSRTVPVASAAGSIDLRAREGILFAGSLVGEAGTGERGGSLSVVLDREDSPGAATGASPYPQEDRVLTLAAAAPADGIIPAGLGADQPIVGREGQGWLRLDAFATGGFDRLSFKSQNVLAFAQGTGGLTLHAGSSLVLDAPAIRTVDTGTVTLSSAYVQLGSSDWRYQSPPAASGGTATLTTVLAGETAPAVRTLDLIGYSATQGFGNVELSALSDIRLAGAAPQKADGSFVDLGSSPDTSSATDKLLSAYAPGAFSVGGNLRLSSAQTFVTSLSDYTLKAPAAVTLIGNGGAAPMPYSAGGKLSIAADVITQNGVLRAPFGSITLKAATALSYGAGSLTSVAGSGLVPFGAVQNGRDWVYDYGNGWAVNFVTLASGGTSLLQTALPVKSLSSQAPSITVDKNATLDLSGGGELYAYEFSPGPGGSKDVLAKSTSNGLTFAVLPGYAAQAAPRDAQYSQDNSLQAGDSVYLSGIAGLPAGRYTLLPAHYALLPGAFAITALAGTQDMAAAVNRVSPDGSSVVAGYRYTSTNGASDSRWSGFSVLSSAQVRARSEYADYTAGAFLSAQAASKGVAVPSLPADGGQVVFDVGQILDLAGRIKLGAAYGGRAGSADIAASGELSVVATADQAGAGSVVLTQEQVTALGADSLLLGGLRSRNDDGTLHIEVKAEKVTLGSDTAHPLNLSGPDLIFAANDTVSVKAGATLTDKGVPGSGSQDISIVSAAGGLASGGEAEGALLRLNGRGAAIVHRGALAASVTRGTLSIDPSASVGAAGGMILDATKSFGLASVLDLAVGSALTVGASAISLGDAIPASVSGVHFDSNALARLNKLSSLGLSSYASPIGFYGSAAHPFSLGNSGMSLTLAGQGLQAYGSGDAQVQAKSLAFSGGSGYAPADGALPSAAVGKLTLGADDVRIDGGSFRVNGYSLVTINAAGDVMGAGSGNFTAGSALTLLAGRITAASGSNTTIAATGALTLGKSTKAPVPATTAPFGGRLGFSGSSIVSSADIEAHAGRVDITSTGGIDIQAGSIDVSGVPVALGDAIAYAPGGSVYLASASGQVSIAGLINVSAVGAEAGLLSVIATNGSDGRLALTGTLRGFATAGTDRKAQTQGRFMLDADRISDFGAFNLKLDDAGFGESRDFRLRHDDVLLDFGEKLTAHQTRISVDNGSITVGGTIDATGAKGGSIELYAAEATAGGSGGKVMLQSTALLDASSSLQAADVTSAAGAAGDGGRIVIGSGTADDSAPARIDGDGGVTITGDAKLKVNAVGAGQGGTVLLRAPRVGNDVAVSTDSSTTLANAIEGASDFAIEAYRVYKSSGDITIGTTGSYQVATSAGVPAGTLYSNANSYLSASHKTAMQSRLGTAAKLRAGIEVRASGNLTVSVNENATNPQDRGWNLNAWRFGGDAAGAGAEAGVLTLRAGGNLTINGSISDGFSKPALAVPLAPANLLSMPDWALDSNVATNASSWSFRLAAGADTTAANPMAVKASTSSGDFKLAFATRTPTPAATDQPVALLRTGAGRIDIAAGRDIVLGSTTSSGKKYGAQIYTAGQAAATPGFTAPSNTLNKAYGTGATFVYTDPLTGDSTDFSVRAASFGSNGGDISLDAKRDVSGVATLQMVNNWFYRQGRVASDGSGTLVANTAWWSRYDYFNEGVATFGGGDIAVVAGGTVKDFSASVATSAWTSGTVDSSSGATLAAGALLTEQGGGDLRVRAGGDIQGGVFYVQKGSGSLRADGSVTSGSIALTNSLWTGTQSLYPVLAIGDATFQVTAGKDLALEGAFNPTLANQSTNNIGLVNFVGSTPNKYSAYSTYGNDSSVGLTAVSGKLSLFENQTLMRLAATTGTTDMPAVSATSFLRDSFLLIMPPTLKAAALNGDILLGNGFSLWPAANGNLDLLAAGSLKATQSLKNGWIQALVMLDLAPDSLPTAVNPRILNIGGTVTDFTLLSGKSDGLPAHTSAGLHAADTLPVRLIAGGGDVDFSLASSQATRLIVPKSAEVSAAGDILNFGFKIQNLNTDDVTSITAGRDFMDTTLVTGANNAAHLIEGPGRVEILAGRNIDLGNSSQGVITRGNLDNPYLPDAGASVMLLAGSTKPDYAGFLRSTLGMSGSDADLSAYASVHRADVNDRFFAELAKVSGATNEQNLDLAAFDALIASLFPAATVAAGDVNVFGSEVKTERGGSIDLFAPGGSVFAGLVNIPSYLKTKSASKLGIFTIKGGEIRSLVKEDFTVNQGRVFTLGGGDITLVSQYGNIDAGRGAKTASSTPPPLVTTDASGNVSIDISGSISGSGIATLQTSPEILAANVYPIAPRGIFDAGDAGIRSSGSVNIVAQTVLNANNIAAAGSVSGAKTADTSGLGAAVAAPSSAPVTKTDAFANAAAPDPNAATSLTVELLGFGAGDGQQTVTQGGQNSSRAVADDGDKKKPPQ